MEAKSIQHHKTIGVKMYISENFNEKLKTIKKDLNKLHVISDFDRTLTKNNEKIISLISLLREKNYINKEYSKKAKELAGKYRAIEIDPDIDIETKKQKMEEWWLKHYELLKEHKLNKKHIDKILEDNDLSLKKGVKTFLKWLNQNNIPLIIISSNGLGYEIIKKFLEKENSFYENIHIISNKIIWDKDGYIKDVEKPVIHSFNKDEQTLKNIPVVWNKIKDRKNIILLGDNEADSKMANNTDYEAIIKICLLGEQTKNLLEEYKKLYDLIYISNNDFTEINKILNLK